MWHILGVIACVGLAMIVHQSRADDATDAILVLESGKVVLCVSASSGAPVDPHLLLDGTIYNRKLIWGNVLYGRSAGYSLQVISDQNDVGVLLPHTPGLILGYSAETRLSSTESHILRGDPGQIEYGSKFLKETMAIVLPAVARRAQELGATTERIRLTSLAYVDINEDDTWELAVGLSSTPDPATSETARPGQFAGVFLLTAVGEVLAEQVVILGQSETGTRLQIRLAAAGRNPFVRSGSGQWDFLIETIRQLRRDDGTWTRVRTIEVKYYAASKLVLRNQMSLTRCLGSGCPN